MRQRSRRPCSRSGSLPWRSGRVALAIGWMTLAAEAQTPSVDWVTRLPQTKHALALTYDLARDRVVMFGGGSCDLFGYPQSQTWELAGDVWSLRSPASSPLARESTAMAYDATRQRTVLFGGYDGTTTYSDTWEWDGNAWSRRLPASSPPARAGHAMVYDSARQRVVLFGGTGVVGRVADTWEWDGNWSQRFPATRPPPGDLPMAYDIAGQRVVLFGAGLGAETWEWDGATWTQRSPATRPSARYAHAMTYDLARQRVVLFGGDDPRTRGRRRGALRPSAAVPFPGVRARVATRATVTRGGTWLYGPLVRATTQPLGAACPGTNGPPTLSTNEPYLGNAAFTLDLLSARATTPCAFGIAARPVSLGIGGGCTLYLDNPIILLPGFTNPAGFATTKLTVPLETSLRGGALFAQAFVADPLGPVLGLALTGGRALLMGD